MTALATVSAGICASQRSEARALGGLSGLFVEPAARAIVAQPPIALPSVAVLSNGTGGAAVAAAISLALADHCGRPCALVATVGPAPPGVVALSPAAARAAARLRRSGQAARARGRLIWLAGELPQDGDEDDPTAAAAGLSARVARAAAAIGAPSALALPLARSAALDRILAWHDGVVVVQEPGASAAIAELVLDSLAALGRPVTAVVAPSRVVAQVVTLGLHTPGFAAAAVERLGLREMTR
ncbi:MAG TPA: hypothetical protein VLK58_25990 [Conexibacter sp.]|nr:hypothetical protein [Conexibacter sp.]